MWVTVGLLLVACTGVASYLLFNSATERVTVLVSVVDIESGDRLTPENIGTADVLPSTAAVGITLEEYLADPDRVLGRRATFPIVKGAPLQPSSLFAAAEESERVIIGAALAPGQYPQSSIFAGDRVDIILLEPNNTARSVGAEAFAQADVMTVEPLGGGDDLFISLEVDRSESTSIAGALAQGRVRLALIDYE